MNESTSSIRYRELNRQIAYARLSEFPHQQAEVIAEHYTSHAMLALQLRRLLQERRHSHETPNIDAAIAFLVRHIKDNHAHSFGIELEWQKQEGD